MQRQNIIVILQMCDFRLECYGSLRKACNAHDWVYNTLVQKKLPIEKDGWLIKRIPFN